MIATMDADAVMRSIDLEKFDEIWSRYPRAEDLRLTDKRAKYADLRTWLEANIRRAESIGLSAGPPRRVLDLGCGCGYFLLIAALMGHRVLGIDRPGARGVFGEMAALLRVPVLLVNIQPGERLPVETFDAITAHMVTFNGHKKQPWGVPEWSSFLDETMLHLSAGGVACLELNREPSSGLPYTPELEALFVSRGATITGGHPYKPERRGHRLVFRR